jgi:hypothetical protein
MMHFDPFATPKGQFFQGTVSERSHLFAKAGYWRSRKLDLSGYCRAAAEL